jgi:spermidine/putrescine transport system permease protein
MIAAFWPVAESAPKLQMGKGSLIAAHGMFTMALVVIIVRARVAGMDRSLIEASADLGATPLGTFRQVTLPQIFPAILAGFLLAFTFSFDDFIIAFFVAGSETTLPIYVFSSIRRGITPETNVIATLVLAVSLTLLIAAQILMWTRNRQRVSS